MSSQMGVAEIIDSVPVFFISYLLCSNQPEYFPFSFPFYIYSYWNVSRSSLNLLVWDYRGYVRSRCTPNPKSRVILICVLFSGLGLGILGLYCYQCVSNQPGCGTPFNWLWYWGEQCPEYDDKCVKIIERKGGVYQYIILFGSGTVAVYLPKFSQSL